MNEGKTNICTNINIIYKIYSSISLYKLGFSKSFVAIDFYLAVPPFARPGIGKRY